SPTRKSSRRRTIISRRGSRSRRASTATAFATLSSSSATAIGRRRATSISSSSSTSWNAKDFSKSCADRRKAMTLDELNRELAALHLVGFWSGNVTGFEQDIEPKSAFEPHLWKWQHIHEGLLKARELVSLEMSERRTVRLANPVGAGWATPTVHMSVQLVRPAEIAKAHRHSLTALRFVVRGGGAHTTVEGERFVMSPGDLILTPNWTWHDHYNGSAEDIGWLDGHDGPLVKALEVIRVEMSGRKQQPVEAPPDLAIHRYGRARPYEKNVNFPDPPFKYPWEET